MTRWIILKIIYGKENLIKQNNIITAIEISEQLKISLSTAKRRLKKLKESKRIERIGSDKAGHWRIPLIRKTPIKTKSQPPKLKLIPIFVINH